MPVARVEAERCAWVLARGQSAPASTGLLPAFSGKLKPVFLRFGLKFAACLVSQSCPVVRSKGLSPEQVSAPRTCVLSAEQLTLGVTQVCNPLDRASVSEHQWGSCCRPVLSASPVSAVLLNHWYYRVMVELRSWSESVLGSGLGRKFRCAPELLHRGRQGGVVCTWPQASCAHQGRCGWG